MTIDCVKSVLADIGDRDVKVVIVENGSGDNSVTELQAWIDTQPSGTPVELVVSGENTGFSGGHNQGIQAAKAEYYLLFNSDALLRPGFIDLMLAAAEEHPKHGFVTPRLEHMDGEPQISSFRFHTPKSEFLRGANTGQVTSLMKNAEVAIGVDPDPDEIEWASFACILLRGAMIDEIGLMDEGYFLYFEDAEYCLRARKKGWRIHHEPRAKAVHFRGKSGPVKTLQAQKKRLPAYYYASRTRIFYQSYGWAGLMLANLAWFGGRGIAYLRVLAGKPVPKAHDAESVDLWINAFQPLGPRRAPGE